jgi:phenol 2-monooxygenase
MECADLLSYLTIFPKRSSSAYELLGCDPLGRYFFDVDAGDAYSRYGIEVDVGGVVLFRPDGWIATLVELDASSVQKLENYFGVIFLDEEGAGEARAGTLWWKARGTQVA